MKTINLLPKEEKVRDVKSIIFNVILVLLITVFVVLVVFSAFLFNINNYLTPRLDDYRMVNIQLNNYVTKLKTYNEFKEKVDDKAKLIDSLQKEEILWSDVLVDFGEKIPDNAYINYIEGSSEPFYEFISTPLEETKDQAKVKKILFFTIAGYAAEYTDITKLIIEIRNMPNIGEVWINNISKSYITISGVEALSFNISAYLDIEPYLEEMKAEGQTQTEEAPKEKEALDTELQSLNE